VVVHVEEKLEDKHQQHLIETQQPGSLLGAVDVYLLTDCLGVSAKHFDRLKKLKNCGARALTRTGRITLSCPHDRRAPTNTTKIMFIQSTKQHTAMISQALNLKRLNKKGLQTSTQVAESCASRWSSSRSPLSSDPSPRKLVENRNWRNSTVAPLQATTISARFAPKYAPKITLY
jgi:hypothetical protein